MERSLLHTQLPMEAHKATIMGFYAVLASPFCFIQTQTYVYNNHQRQKGEGLEWR
jgi:hypothetical protein